MSEIKWGKKPTIMECSRELDKANKGLRVAQREKNYWENELKQALELESESPKKHPDKNINFCKDEGDGELHIINLTDEENRDEMDEKLENIVDNVIKNYKLHQPNPFLSKFDLEEIKRMIEEKLDEEGIECDAVEVHEVKVN